MLRQTRGTTSVIQVENGSPVSRDTIVEEGHIMTALQGAVEALQWASAFTTEAGRRTVLLLLPPSLLRQHKEAWGLVRYEAMKVVFSVLGS